MPFSGLGQVKSAILALIPIGELTMMRGQFERLHFGSGAIVQAAGAPASSVYFVESGIMSLLTPLNHGARIETGLVGREGAVGVQAAFGAETMITEIMAQSDVVAIRASGTAVRAAADASPHLQRQLRKFASALHVQVSQTAACNAVHNVERRLARWLLMVHDRTDGDTLFLTHELISLMLGVTRPGVTIAAGALQKAGLIQYARGRLTVVDRSGLEHAACECYRTVADYYAKELG
jgi:CRP-like cAMP-binding protein